MIVSQNDRDAAEYRAGRILAVLAKDTSGVILEIAAMAKAGLPLSDAFVAEFVRRLHGQSPAFNLPIVWLEKKLAEQGKTAVYVAVEGRLAGLPNLAKQNLRQQHRSRINQPRQHSKGWWRKQWQR